MTEREMLRTSVGAAPGLNHPVYSDRQAPSEASFENPFRDGGKLSRDAEDIIVALKTGKLSVISNVSKCSTAGDTPDGETPDEVTDTDFIHKNSAVSPNERKNGVMNCNGGQNTDTACLVENNNTVSPIKEGEVEVQRGMMVNVRHNGPVEHVLISGEKKGNCRCCVIQ